MSNPFQPPNSELNENPGPSGSPVRALAVGILVDNGGTLIASFILTAVYAAVLVREGLSEEQVLATLQELPLTHWLSITGIVLGSYFSALGGYMNERISRTGGYRLGALQATLSICIGLLMGGVGRSAPELIGMVGLTFACVLAGTRLGHRTA